MAPLRGTSLTYLSDIDFDLSRILLVKSDGAVGLLICDFLLVHVSNSTCNHISISYRLGAPPPPPFSSLWPENWNAELVGFFCCRVNGYQVMKLLNLVSVCPSTTITTDTAKTKTITRNWICKQIQDLHASFGIKETRKHMLRLLAKLHICSLAKQV